MLKTYALVKNQNKRNEEERKKKEKKSKEEKKEQEGNIKLIIK